MSRLKISYKRHLAKTISYRIISTLIGFLIMWRASGSVEIGATFGIVELAYKPLQYYIHERVWYRFVKFGLIQEKKKKIDPHIVKVEQPIKKEEPQLEKPKKGKKLSYSKKTV